MNEEWRIIPGFADKYEVSSLGRVRSANVRRAVKRVLKPRRDKDGYQRINLITPDNRHVTRAVHILVAAAFHGPRPPGLLIDHRDADKSNCAAANLRYVTPKENTLKGEQCYNALFTEDQVRMVRRMNKEGMRPLDIAKELERSYMAIWYILQRQTWEHVT